MLSPGGQRWQPTNWIDLDLAQARRFHEPHRQHRFPLKAVLRERQPGGVGPSIATEFEMLLSGIRDDASFAAQCRSSRASPARVGLLVQVVSPLWTDITASGMVLVGPKQQSACLVGGPTGWAPAAG